MKMLRSGTRGWIDCADNYEELTQEQVFLHRPSIPSCKERHERHNNPASPH